MTLSDEQPFAQYFSELKRVPKLADTAAKYAQASRDEEQAFWMEMVLEGLQEGVHIHRCEHHFIAWMAGTRPVIIAILHERMDFVRRLKGRL